MKEIINFTRPYNDKKMYVEVKHDKEQNTFYLYGEDVFGNEISEVSKNYNSIMQSFYRELCWMLNHDVMADTAIQRTMPKTASRNKKPTKKDSL